MPEEGLLLVVKDGEATASILMKDHSFTMPMDSKGKPVVVQVSLATILDAMAFAADIARFCAWIPRISDDRVLARFDSIDHPHTIAVIDKPTCNFTTNIVPTGDAPILEYRGYLGLTKEGLKRKILLVWLRATDGTTTRGHSGEHGKD